MSIASIARARAQRVPARGALQIHTTIRNGEVVAWTRIPLLGGRKPLTFACRISLDVLRAWVQKLAAEVKRQRVAVMGYAGDEGEEVGFLGKLWKKAKKFAKKIAKSKVVRFAWAGVKAVAPLLPPEYRSAIMGLDKAGKILQGAKKGHPGAVAFLEKARAVAAKGGTDAVMPAGASQTFRAMVQLAPMAA